MQNHSTVLHQTTRGIHLNFERHFASPPSQPTWLTQLQQQDWQQRGIVVWDAGLHIVAHLYAGYALKLLAACKVMMHGRPKVVSPVRQLFNSLPIV